MNDRPFLHAGVLAASALALAPLALAQAPDSPPPKPPMRVVVPAPAAATPPAAAAPSHALDYIVAVVNNEPVTNQEVRTRARQLQQSQARASVAALPPEALLHEALEQLISERAQLQAARESGVNVTESAINQAAQTVAQQNQLSLEDFLRRLNAEGISENQFRAGLRDQLLMLRVREREIEPRVSVSDQDIDQFLRQQRTKTGSGGGGEQINLTQVLVTVPEDSTPEEVSALQARARRAAERARNGDDFAALARQFSDAPNAREGGEMGLRDSGRYPPLFISATQGIPVGGIAGPIRSPAGFHVLKVLDRQKAQAAITVTASRARHILLRTSAQLTEAAARRRLADLKRMADSGTDFATLAREYSQDGSAAQGGELGWTMPGQFVPEFEQAMNALSPGQISDPVPSRFGVHLIQLLERRQTQLSERDQRDYARNVLREKKANEAADLWAQEARGRAYVEMRQAPSF